MLNRCIYFNRTIRQMLKIYSDIDYVTTGTILPTGRERITESLKLGERVEKKDLEIRWVRLVNLRRVVRSIVP